MQALGMRGKHAPGGGDIQITSRERTRSSKCQGWRMSDADSGSYWFFYSYTMLWPCTHWGCIWAWAYGKDGDQKDHRSRKQNHVEHPGQDTEDAKGELGAGGDKRCWQRWQAPKAHEGGQPAPLGQGCCVAVHRVQCPLQKRCANCTATRRHKGAQLRLPMPLALGLPAHTCFTSDLAVEARQPSIFPYNYLSTLCLRCPN